MIDITGRAKTLRIETRDIEGCLTISVEDSGRGLEPLSSGKIYDAFFTTKPEGMGMGLAICRSIAEMHGGRLWYEPRRSDGIRFIFQIPVVAGLAPIGPRDQTVVEGGLPGGLPKF